MDSCLAFWPSKSLQHRAATSAAFQIGSNGKPLISTATWATENSEEDDDGWGTSSDFLEDKTKELRALQTAEPRSNVQSGSDDPQERDFFIPIFAIVSLLGLFGSYGYEMVRLASRGELYLPWSN